MDKIKEIISMCKDLTALELQEIIDGLQMQKSHHTESELIQTRKEIVLGQGYQCPHCESKKYSIHDRTKKFVRLQCKDCKKKYSEHTGTVLAGLHKPHLWPRLVELTMEGRSLRYIAKDLQISLPTAFTWRHKLLCAIKADQKAKKLSGIVEVDEKEFYLNEKGSRNLDRKALKRPSDRLDKPQKDKKLTVMVTVERKSRKSSMKLVKKGRLDKKTLDKELLTRINKKTTTLCTDAHPTYYGWSNDNDLPHYWVVARKGQFTYQDIYHVQNINSLNSRFNKWFDRFNGVASKYLSNYLNYFNLLENTKKHKDKFQRVIFEILKSSTVKDEYDNINSSFKRFYSSPSI